MNALFPKGLIHIRFLGIKFSENCLFNLNIQHKNRERKLEFKKKCNVFGACILAVNCSLCWLQMSFILNKYYNILNK